MNRDEINVLKDGKMSERIGVYVCECGPNIADKVDIDKILEEISSFNELPERTIIAKRYGLLCSNEGQDFLADEIKKNELTHLVVAACSPRDHDITFMNVCKKTNLNPYLYKLVNIREHCAWIIPDKEEATRKAIQYIRAGMSRVLYQTPLLEKELDSIPDVLVIGGGIAGIEASLSLASQKRTVYLVERTPSIGDKITKFEKILPHQGTSLDVMQKKIQAVQHNENIRIFIDTEVEKVIGFFGNFEVTLRNVHNESITNEIKAGAIVVATGFDLFNPQKVPRFGYGKIEDVYTSLEIEEMNSKTGEILLKSGKSPKSVALIHCVGREEKGYCSQICCNYMFKIAQYLKEKLPNIKITEFYQDLCLPNKADQEFFIETKNKGVDFIRIKNIAVKQTDKGKYIEYTGMDGKKGEISADMVILAPAVEPADGSVDLAELLNIPLDENGFFQEVHQKLNPVATSIEGIFIIGSAQGPKNISDSIMQAQAVGGKILTQLIPGKKLVPEVKVSEISEAFCTGCQTCLSVCFYSAISFDEDRSISVVNEAICRGCGNCAASCPSGAAHAKHFTSTQLYQEVMEAIR